jgi:peptidoglycan-N-acetylglucosamine deacetylase
MCSCIIAIAGYHPKTHTGVAGQVNRKYISYYLPVRILLVLVWATGMVSCKQATAPLPETVAAFPKAKTDSFIPCDSCTKIYLSFDDGPHSGTDSVENILTRAQVPASFFEVGAQYSYSDTYKSMSRQISNNPLFRIYNHTYSHAANNHFNTYYRSPEQVWNDIQKNKEILGLHSNISRLPGNNVWITPRYIFPGRKKIAGTVSFIEAKGTEYITGWDVEWNFNNQTHKVPPIKELLNKMDQELRKKLPFPRNLVILMHDFMFQQPENAAKLDSFVMVLKARKDIRFQWIEEHPCFTPVKVDSLVQTKILAQK